jgi:hypothetical protein
MKASLKAQNARTPLGKSLTHDGDLSARFQCERTDVVDFQQIGRSPTGAPTSQDQQTSQDEPKCAFNRRKGLAVSSGLLRQLAHPSFLPEGRKVP